MPFKKIQLIIAIVLSSLTISAQQETADIGLFAGGGTVFGDYTKMYMGQSIGFNFGGFYRYNFNSRYGFRINVLYGTMRGAGELNTNLFPLNFNKNLFEASAIMEFNYSEFIIGVENKRFSPYVFAGIGMVSFPNAINVMEFSATIPFGTGIKYSLTERLGVGAEVSLRKTFNDAVDNQDNPYEFLGLPKVSDMWHNNDWISYYGVTMTYKFYWGKKPCPAYDSLN